MNKVTGAIEQDTTRVDSKKDSQDGNLFRAEQVTKSHEIRLPDELGTMNRLEQQTLVLALGVLRSNTDYGDFLNDWLNEYGRQVLSPNPPPPLLPERSTDELLESVLDIQVYVH